MLIFLIAHAVTPALAADDCAHHTDPAAPQVEVSQPFQPANTDASERSLHLIADDPACARGRTPDGQKPVGGISTSTPLVPMVPVYDPNDPSTGQIGPAIVAPLLTFSANPATVAEGGATELSWTGGNVIDCTASDAWSGRLPTEGSQSTDALTENTTYTLTCTGPLGTVSRTITVGVDGGTAVPEVSITATPDSVGDGESSTLTWSASNATVCTSSGAWNGPRPLSGSVNTGGLSQTSIFTLTCVGPGGQVSDNATVTVSTGPLPPASFVKETIAPDRATWGKRFADINGDGLIDIIEGGGAQGTNVFWYRNPDWQRFQIGSGSGGDDIKAGDINNDGALDIVVTGNPISWYENPAGSGGNPQSSWQRRSIANYRAHDVALHDMDRDGKLDVIIRMADSAFPATRIHLQGDNGDWPLISLWGETRGFGGLAVADIDSDGRLDVVGDGYWLRQPAPADIMDGNNWTRYDFVSWPTGSSISVADINKDGRLDISLAVSEVGVGQFAWFEAPANPLTQPWTQHSIDIVEDVHRHHLVDMNGDGELDIVFAEMYQTDTDRVGVYYNQGNGDAWILDILETHASHNLAIADVDNDGDIDFIGANWRLQGPAGGDLFLWRNQTNP
ncbi:MAG: FG-GAP-like repeat-containing protein [Pseudomonadota bacterium]